MTFGTTFFSTTFSNSLARAATCSEADLNLDSTFPDDRLSFVSSFSSAPLIPLLLAIVPPLIFRCENIVLRNLNELTHNSYAFWTKIVQRSIRCLVAVLSNLAVVIFPSGYEETISATLRKVGSTPESGNHRRKIASACESGSEMAAFGPIADGFDEVAGGRLVTQTKHKDCSSV